MSRPASESNIHQQFISAVEDPKSIQTHIESELKKKNTKNLQSNEVLKVIQCLLGEECDFG